MRFDVVTLFPETFAAVTASGITRRALEQDLWQLVAWNPRDFTTDAHRTVDDRPFGGGPGMLMMAEPLAQAVAAARAAQLAAGVAATRVIALTATGRAAKQGIIVPSNAPQANQMPAAGLAAESGAPILYVSRSLMPTATARALGSLHHPSIYVVDPAQVSSTVLAELRRFGALSEISDTSGSASGEAAAANAVTIARYTDGSFGWGVKEPGHGLVFANSARPLDAPAAAPLSATGDYGPLLLLESPTAIPPVLSAYLGDIQPAYTSAPSFRPVRGVYNHGWLIGDESAISATSQAEIDSLLQISPRKSNEEPSVAPAE